MKKTVFQAVAPQRVPFLEAADLNFSQKSRMKSFLYIVLFYLCLSLLVVSCSESNDPEPACMQVEVIGPDNCQEGWYVLKLQDSAAATDSQSNSYIGQLQGGYVTTHNLPEEYRQAGRHLRLSLEVDDEPTQVCQAIHVIYPTVRVVRVCDAAGGGDVSDI